MVNKKIKIATTVLVLSIGAYVTYSMFKYNNNDNDNVVLSDVISVNITSLACIMNLKILTQLDYFLSLPKSIPEEVFEIIKV